MKKRLIALAVAASLLSAARFSSAAIIYSYVSDQTAYSISAGQSLTIPIYLQETVTSPDSSLIASDGGLFGAGFSISEPVVPLGGTTLSAIGGNSTNFPGGNFTPNPSNSATSLAGDNAVNPVASAGPVPNADGLIQIGTVSFVGGSAGTTTDFLLANFAYPVASDGYTDTFQSFYNLDATDTSPAFTGASTDPTTISITVPSIVITPPPSTPEPATLGICLLGLGTAMFRRSRKAST